ncbi:unnamed protein product [Hermetia illucens]|uniref:THAP-type domain-containing protein n=1 Tax=Hermetia illucens TaxID=343691 RepID=A0A7R8V2K1_HERIL|nr:unnamed protein product [Hermetia illucens]
MPDDFVYSCGANRNVRVLKSNAVPSVYKAEFKQEEEDPFSMDEESGMSGPGPASKTQICAVDGCTSHARQRAGITYHPLPVLPNVRKAWFAVIRKHTKQRSLPDDALVCSAHFNSDCFLTDPATGIRRVKRRALPSIFILESRDKDEFPPLNQIDVSNPEAVKAFYNWCFKNHVEKKNKIQMLEERAQLQAKRIAAMAASVDDFKMKNYVSEEANNSLQELFDRVIEAQFDVL